MSEYIATIGLEIHAELKTRSKMFCACINDPDEEMPNKNACPICLGHPGTLPVLNLEAMKHVIKIGLALNGNIAEKTEWDRKNYFYPDIPKGYQISQYKYPLVSGGSLAGVELERIHLEEDTAQSTHDTHQKSLVNFNRSGVPLMELVTKPVIHDALTAVKFAKELQLLLRYLNAGEANLEKGEMRIEANISVSKKADHDNGKLGTKTEVKNLNSFRAVEKSIAYEIKRQCSLLEDGGKVIQETRGWDDIKNETYSQRSKESSHDYRYFPDPDIPKLEISKIAELNLNQLKSGIPELPWNKRERYKTEYGMTDKEVAVFVDNPEISLYFEKVIESFQKNPKKIKLAVNYILTDYLGLLKNSNIQTVSESAFAELIEMIANESVSSRGAKDLLALLIKSPTESPKKLAEKNDLIQKSDASALSPIIEGIITNNPKVIKDYKDGKAASMQFLIGQAMRATKGSANPEVLRQLFEEKLR